MRRKFPSIANIKCKVNVRDAEGTITSQIIDTVAGRLVFNQFVPDEVGYVNELFDKEKAAADYCNCSKKFVVWLVPLNS